jgi:hypothetical protein
MKHKKESVLSYDYVDVNIDEIKKKDLTFYPLDFFSGKVPPVYMKFFFWKYERVRLIHTPISIVDKNKEIMGTVCCPPPNFQAEQEKELFDNLYIRYTKNDKVVFTNKVNDMKKGWHKIKGGDSQLMELGIPSNCADMLYKYRIERIQLQLRGYIILNRRIK